MDLDSAVKTINRLLIKKQPLTFNSSWIREYAPKIYRFIQKNIRREIGGIDWDRITRALDRKFRKTMDWLRDTSRIIQHPFLFYNHFLNPLDYFKA